jgi:hypothetical protein
MEFECFKKLGPIYGVFFVIFIVYGLSLYSKGFDKIAQSDPLNKILLQRGEHALCGWGISHFVMYLIIGYLFPDCWQEATILGIIWELIEYAIGFFFINEDTQPGVKYKIWWSGSVQDIVLNTAGLAVGVLLAKVHKQETQLSPTHNKCDPKDVADDPACPATNP